MSSSLFKGWFTNKIYDFRWINSDHKTWCTWPLWPLLWFSLFWPNFWNTTCGMVLTIFMVFVVLFISHRSKPFSSFLCYNCNHCGLWVGFRLFSIFELSGNFSEDVYSKTYLPNVQVIKNVQAIKNVPVKKRTSTKNITSYFENCSEKCEYEKNIELK